MNSQSLDRPVRVIAFTPDIDSACGYIRVTAPHQCAGIELVQGNIHDSAEIENFDLVLIQRDLVSSRTFVDKLRSDARFYNKPIVYEFDDLLFGVPQSHFEKNEYRLLTPAIVTAMLESDYVLTTTDLLARAARSFNPNVYVVPNYLDDTIWPVKEPAPKPNSKKVRLAFMGTTSHLFDIKMIGRPLIDAAQKYADKLEIVFVGLEPPEELAALPNVSHLPVQVRSYKEFVDYFSKQDFDFGIAPLMNNWFNRCKSGIKYLEYAALGMPGIYTPLEPYKEIVKHEVTGLFATSEAEWFEAIERLVLDDQLRLRLARAASEDLKESWLLSKRANGRKTVYLEILKHYPPERNPNANLFAIAKFFEESYDELRSEALVGRESRKLLQTILQSRTWKLVARVAHYGNRAKLFGEDIVSVFKRSSAIVKDQESAAPIKDDGCEELLDQLIGDVARAAPH